MAGESHSKGSDRVALAREAADRGRAALETGDAACAIRWLERAHRLVPSDQNVLLSLATTCLGHDPARAERVFRDVAEASGVREAWLGVAAAQFQRGNHADAAAALAHALRHNAADIRVSGLAGRIAEAAGAPGWCGVAPGGRLIVDLTRAGTPEIRVDGKRITALTLPGSWRSGNRIEVTISGRDLLGSPLNIAAIGRTTGCVSAHDGRLTGWAWHPGEPETDPVLIIEPDSGGPAFRIVANDRSVILEHAGALAQPRGFTIPESRLRGYSGLVHVRGLDGRDILGSPLDPAAERVSAIAAAMALASNDTVAPVVGWCPGAAEIRGPTPPIGVRRRRRDVAIVVPVHGGTEVTLACLDSVLRTVSPAHRIVVVDDGSPEPELRDALDRLKSGRRITLLRHSQPVGFAASANAGITACARRDVILLNSDTIVSGDWVERLREVALSAIDIGTVTPLSNDASIVSYPGPAGTNAIPNPQETSRLDHMAWRANGTLAVEIPVGVGFCLYLRRDCLDATGLFRASLFAQGYGEENDFCLRARHLGWRHVAAPGVFVAHRSGASFGGAGRHLRARNEALIERLHPGYAALVQDFGRADPLGEARRKIDLLRWRAGKREGGSAILVTHNHGGGVERVVGERIGWHRQRGLRPVVVRPCYGPDGAPCAVIGDGPEGGFPGLRYAMPGELPALLRLLRGTKPHLIEVHHLLAHAESIYDMVSQLGIPYDIYIHDYGFFCARLSLVGPSRRYCGEPSVSGCEACVADSDRMIDEDITIGDFLIRSATFLSGARRVYAPSKDAAERMRRHFPGLRVAVAPLGDDSSIPPPGLPCLKRGICRVCIAGAMGIHKGYDVVLACARDASERQLPMEFVITGHSIDDARLMATGKVFVTGEYEQGEAVPLIRAQDASLAFLPSVWPETWSFTLAEAWEAGLHVAAFDFGAPAERIRRTGYGFLLSPGLAAAAINDALLGACEASGSEYFRLRGQQNQAISSLS